MDEIEKIKRDHPGEWISVRDKKIVATSKSHRVLYKKLKEKKIDSTYVIYSPTEKEKRYSFLFFVYE